MPTLATFLSGSSTASAESPVLYPSPPAFFIVLLPLVGAIVLILVALPPLLGRPYWRETPAFHIANTVTVTSLVTLLMALSVFYVVYEGSGRDVYSLAAITVVATFLLSGLFVRYLLMRLLWATVTAGVMACFIVLLSYLAVGAANVDLWWTLEGLMYLLPLFLLVWLGLLAWETARFHYVEGEGHEEPETPGLPRRRRMLRLGELLIANMALGAGLLLMLTS
jgi:hypothetical protein